MTARLLLLVVVVVVAAVVVVVVVVVLSSSSSRNIIMIVMIMFIISSSRSSGGSIVLQGGIRTITQTSLDLVKNKFWRCPGIRLNEHANCHGNSLAQRSPPNTPAWRRRRTAEAPSLPSIRNGRSIRIGSISNNMNMVSVIRNCIRYRIKR